MRNVSKGQVRKLIGKSIYAMRKDGSVVSGKLLRLRGHTLILSQKSHKAKGEKVRTKAFILPLVLFDLLVIATLPYWGGGYGGGYGGGCEGNFGGYGSNGYGEGYGGYGGGYGGEVYPSSGGGFYY